MTSSRNDPDTEKSSRSGDATPMDVSSLSYEAAREELVMIVSRLESGQVPLEDSMRLWERGEALADHCAAWLDGAERRLRGEPAGQGEAVGDGDEAAGTAV